MSMWLNLAKVSPALLAEIRTRPDLLDALFFEESSGIEGFDPHADVLGCDYRTLSAIAEAMAGHDDPALDWRDQYPGLSRATGEADVEYLDGYEFTYGPAFAIAPEDLPAVLESLVAEDWTYDDLDELEEGDTDAAEADEDDELMYGDVEDLVPFFEAAAREGKAVVGGIG
jgi:hypothetical protein